MNIIFDLDDTLYFKSAPFFMAAEEFFPSQVMDGETRRKLFEARKKHNEYSFFEERNGRMTLREMYIYRTAKPFGEIGIELTDEQCLSFEEVYTQKQKELTLDAPIKELLSFLKEKGIFTAVITNGMSGRQRDKMRAMGVTEYIPEERILVSEDIGINKPDVRIFREAESRWGLRPCETWYVGDGHDTDMAGSEAAGWHQIWLDTAGKGLPAENTVHTAEEMCTFIKELVQEDTKDMKTALGLDIGTTTISATVIDADTKKQLRSWTVDSESFISTDGYRREQSPEIIMDKLMAILKEAEEQFPGIVSIGLTGQMHGILFTDEDGKAVSPLFTWQDERGNLPFADGISYADEMTRRTGMPMHSGYGFSTVFWHSCTDSVPSDAVSFCSIMDYAGMCLTGRKRPLVHSSDAASFGLYDLKAHRFDMEAVEKLSIDASLVPDTTDDSTIVGTYKGIPVSVAIGDNQASFYSVVRDEDTTISVNCGTGSQVSVAVSDYEGSGAQEVRPYIGGKYLLNGSALCGGRAYAILEHFVSDLAYSITGEKENRYELLNLLAKEGSDTPLTVDTRFAGTRDEPSVSGSITGISETNFTPANLVSGVLYGIAGELLDLYKRMGAAGHTKIAATGNGLRKNEALVKITEKLFGVEVFLPDITEEAAYGAALFGLICK